MVRLCRSFGPRAAMMLAVVPVLWLLDSRMAFGANEHVVSASPALELLVPSNGAVYQGSFLSWMPVLDAVYDVYFDVSNPPERLLAVGVGQNSVALPASWFAGTAYYWRVVARHSGGTISSQVSTFTAGPCPWNGKAPMPLAPGYDVSESGSLTTFSWTSVAGASAYILGIGPSSSVLSTVAGKAGTPGSSDGASGAARFRYPEGVAADPFGNLFVADTQNHTIRKISASGEVSTVAGLAGVRGFADGTGPAARFAWPGGLAADAAGNVYVADTVNDRIRKVTPQGQVTTLPRAFYSPSGVAVDSSGNLYVAERGGASVWRVSADGTSQKIAGGWGVLSFVAGVAAGPDGVVYVSESIGDPNCVDVDCNPETIKRIAPSGAVSLLAGSPRTWGFADGKGSEARFYFPDDIAIDGSGILFVADSANRAIRRVTPDGVVTTVTSALPFRPQGVATGAAGDIFIAGTNDHTIRKLSTPAPPYRRVEPPFTSASLRLAPGKSYSWRVTAMPGCGGSVPVASTTMRFSTPAGPVALQSVTPAPANRWQDVELTLAGSGFTGASQVFTERAGASAGTLVQGVFLNGFSGPSSLSASLVPNGAAPAGRYDLGVTEQGIERGRLLSVLALRVFTDVSEDDYYFESSGRVSDAGIMEHDADPVTPDPQFLPSSTVSRGALSAYLARAHQYARTRGTEVPEVSCTAPDFADVPCGHPDWLTIHWLKEWGLAAGGACDLGSCYFPERTATRAEAVTFLERLKQRGVLPSLLSSIGEVDPGCQLPYPSCSGWTDPEMKTASWPRREFNVAFADQLTRGCSGVPSGGLTACSGSPITRAQIAELLARALGMNGER